MARSLKLHFEKKKKFIYKEITALKACHYPVKYTNKSTECVILNFNGSYDFLNSSDFHLILFSTLVPLRTVL